MLEKSSLAKKLIELEILSNKVSKNIFLGNYKSAFKGQGMSFDRVREYVVGDDVRHIDWNVTARYNTPHVKIFQEERDLEIVLMLDFSASMNFGSVGTKKDLMIELAAILLFTALRNRDKVGVLLFTDKAEKFFPPAVGRKHTLKIITELIRFTPSTKKSNFSTALKSINAYLTKPAYIFSISDYLVDSINDKELLKCVNKHDFVALRLFDSFESRFPLYGFMKVYHSESENAYWVNTFKRWNKSVFHGDFIRKYNNSKQTFEKKGVKIIELETGKDYVPILGKHFKIRK